MIEFETRNERQKDMLVAIRKVIGEAMAGGGGGAAANPMGLMQKVMGGELAKYMDLLMSTAGGVFPVKVDVARQLAMYGGATPGEGIGMAKFTAKVQPVKYALTAMGLAAIASGKGGQQIIMQKYLPQIVKGKLFCYCITEPGAGTNTNRIVTTAIDEGDHFRLNGQKTYISAADTAHFMVAIAKIVRDGQDEGVGTFVMETQTKGITMTEMDIAVLGDKQFTIYFDDVILPKDALVGSKDTTKSRKISNSVFVTLNLERIIVALTTVGLCKEALAMAAKRANSEPTLGQSSQIKQRLAKAKLKFELANLATKKACEAYDQNVEPVRVGMYANMAKLLSTEAGHEACDLALSLYGVQGLDKDAEDLGSIYQMARLIRTVPINNEMVLNFLGENLLGLPRSYR